MESHVECFEVLFPLIFVFTYECMLFVSLCVRIIFVCVLIQTQWMAVPQTVMGMENVWLDTATASLDFWVPTVPKVRNTVCRRGWDCHYHIPIFLPKHLTERLNPVTATVLSSVTGLKCKVHIAFFGLRLCQHWSLFRVNLSRFLSGLVFQPHGTGIFTARNHIFFVAGSQSA